MNKMKNHSFFVPISDRKMWDSYVIPSQHTYGHSWEYNYAYQFSTTDEIVLFVCKGNEGYIYCPLCLRGSKQSFDPMTPYGNSGFIKFGKIDNYEDDIKNFFFDKGITTLYASLNQSIPTEHLFNDKDFLIKKTFGINLSYTLDEIFQHIGKNNRRHLKNWEEKKYELIFDQEILKKKFLETYPIFVNSINASKIYHFSPKMLSSLLSSKNVHLIGAKENDNISLIRCFLFTSSYADAFLEAQLPGGNIHSRAIYWESIKIFKEKGVKYLNIGSGIKENDSLEFFKSSFSNSQKNLSVLKWVINRNKYISLMEEKNKIFQSENYFPPYYIGV